MKEPAQTRKSLLHYPPITDWDDAYDNFGHIENAADYPPQWAACAAAFRERMTHQNRAELNIPYGDGARQQLDIFLPETTPQGIWLFVHGGYWKAFDKSSWSWLAEQPLQQGFIVVIPGYTLAPEVRISTMTTEIATAISYIATRFDGPLQLAGHSAGGQLVTRMLCRDVPLSTAIQQRIRLVHSISGLHDLRPLLNTQLNAILGLDEQEARQESPALLHPVTHARLVCTVGAVERPEFIRQNDVLANIWAGLGVETQARHIKDCHHFNVIETLPDPSQL